MIKKKRRTISLAMLAAAMCMLPAAQAQAQMTGRKQAAVVTAAPTPVANAGVRVTCEGNAANAQISINGVFKGDCPIDVAVPEGMVVVSATKALDAVYDNVYSTRFRLGADAIRRVDVKFNGILQFSADAMARADAAVEADLARKEAQQLKELPELERAAQGGDAAAMARLGVIHERGLAGPVSFKKAIAWYDRAAQAGDAAAMSAYGLYLQLGWGVPKDEVQAAALYARAAAKGDSEGMLRMGWLYIHGSAGVEKNPRQAFALLKAAAERGHPDAYTVQSIAQADMGEPPSAEMYDERNVKEALAYIKRAEGGYDYDAMGTAGRYFGSGRYVAKDPELALRYARTALRYYKKAAASGDAWAINKLAVEYQFGFNTPSDRVMAERLYRQAASLGFQQAEANLAKLLKQ